MVEKLSAWPATLSSETSYFIPWEMKGILEMNELAYLRSDTRFMCMKDIIRFLDFVDTYITTTLEPQHAPVRSTPHDTVQELLEAPDKERGTIFSRFLLAEGAFYSERYSSLAAKLDDPWGEEAEKLKEIKSHIRWLFSRAYKQVAMGPLSEMISERVIETNPEHIIDAPTASERFTQTVTDWISSAADEIVEENRGTRLWQYFQHATDTSSAITFCDNDYVKEAIEGAKYPPQMYNPKKWIEKSFLNTLPFVSDLILEAAVNYARYHPDDLTPDSLAKGVLAWMPYFVDMESTFEKTQDLVVFGAPQARRRWAYEKEYPGKIIENASPRWLEALESYETGRPKSLFECAEQCAPSIILQSTTPSPVHPSLKNGPLPPGRNGFCGGQFGENSAAETMLFMSIKAASFTFLRDPACLRAIQDAAKVVDKTPVAESKRRCPVH